MQDGSSYGSPGPAGAGFTVIPSVLVPGSFSSASLGLATNNVAELAALQFLCEHLFEPLSRVSPSSRPPVFVFIDNRYKNAIALMALHQLRFYAGVSRT